MILFSIIMSNSRNPFAYCFKICYVLSQYLSLAKYLMEVIGAAGETTLYVSGQINHFYFCFITKGSAPNNFHQLFRLPF